MDEWNDLGRRILEANPEKYRRLLASLRIQADAEEKLASPEIRVLVEVLRTKMAEQIRPLTYIISISEK